MLQNPRRLILRAVTSSEQWNWFAYVLLLMVLGTLFLLGYLAFAPTGQHFSSKASLRWEADQSCVKSLTNPAIGSGQFRAYVSVDFIADNLCRNLGKSSAFEDRYDSVSADWALPDPVLSQRIFEGHYDLLQLRPEQAEEMGAPMAAMYHRISYYPAYEVHLIARDHAPKLTPEYLESKTLGLLKNTRSRSGYRVPMQAFRAVGIDPQRIQKRRYDSHNELRLALGRGDVDVIASYWNDPLQKQFPGWHTVEIGNVDEGLNWFLAEEVFRTNHHRCAVVNALEDIRDKSGNPYFKKLTITREASEGCRDRS